jgi:hypothetical protein
VYAEAFEATGASVSRMELDALNGATKVLLGETEDKADNYKEKIRFDKLLFESEKFVGIN